MASTLLLNSNWDLCLDANNNIAVSAEPYALAQDAASAIETYLGECQWNTTLGIPYLTQVFSPPGQPPIPMTLLKQILINAALSVSSDIASAEVFFSSFNNRQLSGQVQITSIYGGSTVAASFSISIPPGGTG